MSNNQSDNQFDEASDGARMKHSSSASSFSSIMTNEDSSSASSAQTQSKPSDNKYNISNVLKHIYQIKYNKTNQIQTPSSAASLPANVPNQSLAEVINSNASAHGSKQFWMPDDQVKECYECNDKFTTFRRKHVTYLSLILGFKQHYAKNFFLNIF